MRHNCTYLLPPNLAVTSCPTLLLQRLYPALEDVAEGARVGHEVLELLHNLLRDCIIGVVQRAVVQVGYPRDVVVVRLEVILDRGDLESESAVACMYETLERRW